MINILFNRIKNYGFFRLVFGNINWLILHLIYKLTGKKYSIKKIFNYKMILDITDLGLSKQLIKYKEREMDHKVLLDMIIQPGDHILDIGANIGYYALMESKMIGSLGKVLAVEPSPSNILLLKKNLSLNSITNVDVVQGAISDIDEVKEFYLSNESNLNTFHNYGTITKHLSGDVINVHTYNALSLFKSNGFLERIDLIRMDVEGHEVSVLSGLLEAIINNEIAPKIIFETHLSRYNSENDMVSVLESLFSAGYKTKYAASSWEKGSEIIEQRGYVPLETVKTDGVQRSIYSDIKNSDAIRFICTSGGLRTVVLSK